MANSTTNRGGQKLLAVVLAVCAWTAYGGSVDPLSLLRLQPMPWGGQPPVGIGLAKSIAFDGSIYVVAFQSSTSSLATAQFLGPTGTPFGNPINFAQTISPPLVGFDGTNYLIIWADAEANINGQLMDKIGTTLGAPFVISGDADVTEPGAIVFDGNHYLVIWEAHGIEANAISSIRGQFVTPSGGLWENRIQFSTDPEHQKFPALAFDGVNYLVAWMAPAGATNLWQVEGCFLSTAGAVQPTLVLSQTPAASANPIALAFGRTNYIVVWSREVGPYVSYDYCHTPTNGSPLFTNSWPMMHGRILSANGIPSGPEFQISQSGPNAHPSAAFDGTNFLVSWLDKQQFSYGLSCGSWITITAQEISQSGARDEPELYIGDFMMDADFYSIFAGGRYVFVYNVNGSQVATRFLRRETAIHPRLRNFTVVASNRFGFQLDGNSREGYAIQTSTDLVNWSILGGMMNVWPGTVSWDDPSPVGGRAFYRALSGKFTCIRNQRLILSAKMRWALENNKSPYDAATMDELAGAGKYLAEIPVCPNGGAYFIGGADTFPTCTLGSSDHLAFEIILPPP